MGKSKSRDADDVEDESEDDEDEDEEEPSPKGKAKGKGKDKGKEKGKEKGKSKSCLASLSVNPPQFILLEHFAGKTAPRESHEVIAWGKYDTDDDEDEEDDEYPQDFGFERSSEREGQGLLSWQR